MENKLIVNIEEFKSHLDYFSKINKCKLSDIKIIKDGKEIPIRQEIIDDFEYMGLSNKDFIDMDYWDREFETVKYNNQ